MAKPNAEVTAHWVDGLFGKGKATHLQGGTVVVDHDGVLFYHRKSGERRNAWGPVVLGRYVPRSRTILLNGDGFTERHATDWQSRVRGDARRQMHVMPEGKNVKHVAIIPYAALDAAGIVIDTVRPIHVVEDTNEQVFHRLADNLTKDDLHPVGQHRHGQDQRLVWQGTINGRQYEYTMFGVWGYKNTRTGEVTTNHATQRGWEAHERSYTVIDYVERDGSWMSRNNTVSAWRVAADFRDEDALLNFRANRTVNNDRALQNGSMLLNIGEVPKEPGLYFVEDVHHLGACLFSAESADGGRHKFLSAFDEDEPNQMYFLAQLPDGSGAKTYTEALLALAPPIVHQARLEGREVRRQGDVFAVATKLTDKEVYALAKTRVRREVAMYELNAHAMLAVMQGVRLLPLVHVGEVREKVDCICGCGHKRWIGWGPKARRALSIYRTGHTATEVVVSQKGTTYIKGTLHHDPELEEPGRRREHADVVLPAATWCVAVRNTVPRQSAKRRARLEAEALATVERSTV